MRRVPLLQVAEEVECVLQQRSSGVAPFGRLRQITFDAFALVKDLFEFGLHILRRCFANGDEVEDVVLCVSSCASTAASWSRRSRSGRRFLRE
jgi:hypothetical protein